MRRTIALAVLCFASLSPSVRSQQVDGNLEGRVLDADGKPLAYVNVTVSGPSLQGVRNILSDRQGYLHVPALPVGSYTVRFSHVAHHGLTYENVLVQLGRTTSLGDIRLSPRDLIAPKVVVSGRRPLIDPTTTTLGTNLSSQAFDALPTDRSFRTLATLAPEANVSFLGDDTNISGSTGEETYYFIDGIDATDPGGGGTTTNLPNNFVEEIEVKTGGYEAEYGRALGGIINVITPSGGNELHGETFGFFTNHRLFGSTRNALREASAGDFASYDFGASVNGPFVRDRLWYFGAYNPTFDSRDVPLPGIATQEDARTTHRFAAKLTWRAAERTNVVLTTLGDPSWRTAIGTPFGIGGIPSQVLNADAVTGEIKDGGISVSLKAVHRLRSDVLVKVSIARLHNQSYVSPATERGASEPFFVDQETGTVSGGYGGENRNHSDRWAAQLSATAFWRRHTLKSGFEYMDNAATFDNQFGAGANHRGFIFRTNDSTYAWYQGHLIGTAHLRLPTVYAQDSWLVTDRLRLNFGLRWDGDYMRSRGETVLEVTDGYQPRVGFTYQPGEIGNSKVSGSYGRFYEQLPAAAPGFYFIDTVQMFINYDHDPRVNPAGGDTAVVFSRNPKVDRLEGEHFDEFTLGYERALAHQLKVGLRGHYRTIRQVIEDAFSAPDSAVIGNPGEGALSFVPEGTRDYSALILTAERADGERSNFLLSYVLSRNHGNYAGLQQGNIGQQFDFAEVTVNATGLLPNDRRHALKFYGSYRFDFGLTTGVSGFWQGGTPLNELGAIPNVVGPYAAFLRPRGSLGRTPSIWDLNLRLAYHPRWPSFRSARPRLTLDLFHLFSPRRAVQLDERRYLGTDASGNQTDPNPNYLQPTLYQAPFGARLGAIVDF